MATQTPRSSSAPQSDLRQLSDSELINFVQYFIPGSPGSPSTKDDMFSLSPSTSISSLPDTEAESGWHKDKGNHLKSKSLDFMPQITQEASTDFDQAASTVDSFRTEKSKRFEAFDTRLLPPGTSPKSVPTPKAALVPLAPQPPLSQKSMPELTAGGPGTSSGKHVPDMREMFRELGRLEIRLKASHDTQADLRLQLHSELEKRVEREQELERLRFEFEQEKLKISESAVKFVESEILSLNEPVLELETKLKLVEQERDQAVALAQSTLALANAQSQLSEELAAGTTATAAQEAPLDSAVLDNQDEQEVPTRSKQTPSNLEEEVTELQTEWDLVHSALWEALGKVQQWKDSATSLHRRTESFSVSVPATPTGPGGSVFANSNNLDLPRLHQVITNLIGAALEQQGSVAELLVGPARRSGIQLPQEPSLAAVPLDSSPGVRAQDADTQTDGAEFVTVATATESVDSIKEFVNKCSGEELHMQDVDTQTMEEDQVSPTPAVELADATTEPIESSSTDKFAQTEQVSVAEVSEQTDSVQTDGVKMVEASAQTHFAQSEGVKMVEASEQTEGPWSEEVEMVDSGEQTEGPSMFEASAQVSMVAPSRMINSGEGEALHASVGSCVRCHQCRILRQQKCFAGWRSVSIYYRRLWTSARQLFVRSYNRSLQEVWLRWREETTIHRKPPSTLNEKQSFQLAKWVPPVISSRERSAFDIFSEEEKDWEVFAASDNLDPTNGWYFSPTSNSSWNSEPPLATLPTSPHGTPTRTPNSQLARPFPTSEDVNASTQIHPRFSIPPFHSIFEKTRHIFSEADYRQAATAPNADQSRGVTPVLPPSGLFSRPVSSGLLAEAASRRERGQQSIL